MIREYQTKKLDMIYTADSNIISPWDKAEAAAIEVATSMVENGVPFKKIKWKATFCNHATAAKRAYEAAAKCSAI